MRREFAGEFFGTAFMVAAGCGSVALGASHGIVSLTFGVAVTLAIIAFGPLSGAHINPAVSIAFWRDGQLEGRLLPTYVVAQCTGGIAGALIVSGAAPTSLAPSVSLVEGFGIEVAITAALMTSILLIVQRSSSRMMIALWVGGTVALLAFIAGPLTGASMNPARTLGPNLLNGMWATLPFYVASTTLGAWLACDLKHRFFPDGSSTD
ncbi:MAG: aquaporin [Candidatus Thermoplasmatota archaeon]|nr:aquaporin [Candidatus Thermoplasmatota archaeon]